jgi:hypothetical protein
MCLKNYWTISSSYNLQVHHLRLQSWWFFPGLLFKDFRYFQTCHGHFLTCHWHDWEYLRCYMMIPDVLSVLPGLITALGGAPRGTWRLLHCFSQPSDQNALGFLSDNSQILPGKKLHFTGDWYNLRYCNNIKCQWGLQQHQWIYKQLVNVVYVWNLLFSATHYPQIMYISALQH